MGKQIKKKKSSHRILVITNMYPSQVHPSFGIFIKNQVDALRLRGFDIDVIAVQDPRMGKFRVIRKYFFWALKVAASLLNGKRYDLVHAHYIVPSGLLGLLVKKIQGSRLIITSHGGDLDKMAKIHPLMERLTGRILHQSDYIIAVGEELKQKLVEHYRISTNKLEIINMGVNRKIFRPIDDKKAKDTLQLNYHYTHLLFVGNLIKAKGILELVEAFKQLKKKHNMLQLHLIGAAKEPDFMHHIEALIQNEEDIFIYQPLKQKDIAIWMSAADLFILPSHMEGFGLVALEAMSCHTPVIGSDVGGLSYLLSNRTGLLIQPKNTLSLEKAMEDLLKNENLREELITKGEQKAEQNSQDRLLDQLVYIYHFLIGENKNEG
ncbi:glycosyltransferase family 4 protein [Virgibacillus sp. MSP4-1]|uniref:glycosyltransferase n=1 Tax=Virgibacillus sp. MSP4-1 TaxID=2700081 RepID=UPI00039FC490|nr:glycosyltransferase [Virgibacillus sp. MSP4-1]QHS23514.1 glycosyltransferase family 4 protein [Virgibacillus sp. MSP4-1]